MIKYYQYNELNEYLQSFNISQYKLVSRKKIKYYNIPCSFDIETTSLYTYKGKVLDINTAVELKEANKVDDAFMIKHAFMYIWMLSIDDHIIIGRSWYQFMDVINNIKQLFKLKIDRRLIIYVHNLSYEFQFIRKLFNWSKVFASEPRKVIYAEEDAITFKCSYFLSNTSLEVIGKNLHTYKAEKQVGMLDYNKLRNRKTPLTDDEIKYCLYDVIVLSNYIREKIEEEKSIAKIPLTSTGYVRRYCKKYCNTKFNRLYLSKLFKQMQMDERLYVHLKRAFMGGYTHSNPLNTDCIIDDVYSMDETSAYPSVLCLQHYPMSKPYAVKIKDLNDFKLKLNKYCCLFDISFYGLKLKENNTNSIISKSKCFECENPIEDNGRIVRADKITITLTEVDFKAIEAFYTWDKIGLGYFRIYKKGYLPKCLIECILHFYTSKTQLKDVIGKEREYANLKSMLNSTFGMMVTDIIRNEIDYSGDTWTISTKPISEQLDAYNSNKTRFLSYEWGVWCTAYARYNLFRGMAIIKNSFIYADTDSLKFKHYELYKEWFDKYNKGIDDKIAKVCNKYDLDINLFYPKTKDGVVKALGYWDFDGHYKQFKTQGAKRYMYLDDKDAWHMTISGLNKKEALPYLVDKASKLNENVLNLFDDEMYIPPFNSGKLMHSYIDDEDDLLFKDYLGNSCKMHEYSAVHLEPISFEMNIMRLYKDYINGVQTKFTKDV